jgi:hypothetical protein
MMSMSTLFELPVCVAECSGAADLATPFVLAGGGAPGAELDS